MSSATKGASRERQVRKLLEAEGWAVTRGAGSHGCADLWCARQFKTMPGPTLQGMPYTVHASQLRLIQVKGNTGSPYKTFGPAERRELTSLAAQTGGTAELIHWPARGQMRTYLESEWPDG